MLDQNYNMLVPWYVMSLIYPLQSNIILFALCRLGKYVNKTFTFFFFPFLQLKKPLSTVSIPGSHTALSVNTCTANMSKKTGDGEKSIKSDDKG